MTLRQDPSSGNASAARPNLRTPIANASENLGDQALRGEVTELLHQMIAGKPDAVGSLMPLIYDELRRIARSFMRREHSDHTLEPTALVHEAYLRLVEQNRVTWQSRGHFFSVAATIMRRILVDSSRQRLREKRGGGAAHDEFIESEFRVSGSVMGPEELIALNDALERLAERDNRMVKIVELRFFAGFDVAETAAALGLSEPTIKRNWSVAKAWLARELRSK